MIIIHDLKDASLEALLQAVVGSDSLLPWSSRLGKTEFVDSLPWVGALGGDAVLAKVGVEIDLLDA